MPEFAPPPEALSLHDFGDAEQKIKDAGDTIAKIVDQVAGNELVAWALAMVGITKDEIAKAHQIVDSINGALHALPQL